jgi:hypothetical protein
MDTNEKPIGHHGNWFAEWNGQELYCAHETWSHKDMNGEFSLYYDPHMTTKTGRTKQNQKEFAAIPQIITDRRVIVTHSEMGPEGTIGGRKGYIGVYDIDLISWADDGLRFKFVREVQKF